MYTNRVVKLEGNKGNLKDTFMLHNSKTSGLVL